MAEQFVRGFKADAERIALELRKEVGVGLYSALDPHLLARHLAVPVLALEDLCLANPEDLTHFLSGRGSSEFSAATIFLGQFKRSIIYNSAHSGGRQMSSLCHELGHLILGHETEAPVSGDGQRDWDPTQEREADWLGGCLLIPNESALAAARSRETNDVVAQRFGVSVQLAAWRMNASGARKRIERAHARR